MMNLSDLRDKYKEEYIAKPQGATKYIWRYNREYNNWLRFLKKFKNEKIIDFGCGGGFSLLAGRKLNLHIIGLDVDVEESYRDLNNYHNTKPVYYNGIDVPIFNYKFDVIIFNWSLMFNYINREIKLLTDNELIKRINQLRKIMNKNAIWYISPPAHFARMKSFNVNSKLFTIC